MNYLVIKLGGSVMEKLPQSSFYQNIVQLMESKKWSPIIVHGGGPLINSLLTTLKIETKFINGLRVTNDETLDIVEMVLSGVANKQIVRQLMRVGGKAWGISGVDGGLLKAKPVMGSELLGFVGEVVHAETRLIDTILQSGMIPVISPIGIDNLGQRYNINGDIAASAVASALQAKLLFITDIPGIYIEKENSKQVLSTVTKAEVEQLISEGQIVGGMIPKVKAALDGLNHHIPEVTIINGLIENSLLDYCANKQLGTKLY